MATFTAGQVLTAAELNQLVPPGVLMPYAGAAAPAGYLLCDGAAVSRTTYVDLFTAIGTTYGVGNGTTTFNVPDLRQKFPMGKAASGTGATLGGTGGSKDAIAVTHDHGGVSGGQSVTHTHDTGTGGYSFITNNGALTVATGSGADTVFKGAWEITNTSGASVGHTHTIPSGGSSGTDANLPAYQVFNYIIRT